MQQLAQDPALIAAPSDALDIFDFEPVARTKIPPAHRSYLVTGTDDDGASARIATATVAIELRVRLLIDVSKIDASVQMLGVTYRPSKKCPEALLPMPSGPDRHLVSCCFYIAYRPDQPADV